MKNMDWIPSRKGEQLAMAKTWVTAIKQNQTLWNIPSAKIVSFESAVVAAETINIIPAAQRSKITYAQLKEAFKVLTAEMRDVKKRYFYIPPLDEAALIGLGLKARDNIPTSVSVPKVRAHGKIIYRGAGRIELHISPEADISEDKRAYHGCKILYEVLEANAETPKDERNLSENRFTRRKKEEFVFQPKDAAKRIYFCLRYENSKGQPGPWCPIFSAVIP